MKGRVSVRTSIRRLEGGADAQLLRPRAAEDRSFVSCSNNCGRAPCDDLTRLYGSTPALMCSLDLDGRVLGASERWLKAVGTSVAEVVGRPVADHLAADDRGRLHAWLATSSASAPTLRLDRVSWQSAGGGRVESSLAGYCVLDAEGRPVGRVLQGEELTDERRTAAELAAERQRLSDVLSATGAGVWEWNVATGEVRLCERWAAQIGHSVKSLGAMTVDNTWCALTHPDDLPGCLDALEKHFRGERPLYEAEFRLRHARGGWVWILARGTLKSRCPDGSPEWMLGTHLDISGVKLQQEQLLRTQATLARIGEIASIGSFEVCHPWRRVELSPQARALLGLPPAGADGLRDALARLDRHDRLRLRRAVREARRAATRWQIELDLRTPSGPTRTLHVSGQEEQYDGRWRMVGAVQDVTERTGERRLLDRTQRRLQAANLAGGVGSWTYEFSTGASHYDATLLRLIGVEPGSPTPDFHRALGIVHADDRARLLDAYRHAVRSESTLEEEWRVVLPNGSVRTLHGAAIIERGCDGRAKSVTGVIWDITQPRMLEQQFAQQRALLKVTLNSISDAILTVDQDGTVQWFNSAAAQLLGLDAGGPLALPEPLLSDVRQCLCSGQSVASNDDRPLRVGGSPEPRLEYVCSPVVEGARSTASAVVVIRDVTEQQIRSDAMLWQATHDSLTGLTNRGTLDSRLRHALAMSRDGNGGHALLYVDLDQFKLVNDACGHVVGDQLLQAVAGLITESVRTADTVARLGGDEFAVLLTGCTTEKASRAAQGICDRLDNYRFEWGGRRFRIGASIGLVPIDGRWQDAAEILKAADSACYAAKDAGRNRVQLWKEGDESLRERSGEMQWASLLEQALDEDRFLLQGQRMATLGPDGRGLHVEVLLRMRLDNGQIAMPGAFMPAAERYNLAARIDRRVIQLTLEHLQSLPSLDGIDLVCINLSGKSVGDPLFGRVVADLLGQVPVDLRRRLCLEITETAAVTSMANARALIESVKALEVSVALDDFGAGASSFGYLRELPVDWLKIDGQFVRDLLTDPLDMAAVKCFVEVARVTGLRTVAEFVETQDVFDELRRIGVDCAQGYLVHRPEPLADVLQEAASKARPNPASPSRRWHRPAKQRPTQ